MELKGIQSSSRVKGCRMCDCVFQLIYLPPPWGDCKVTALDSDFFDTYSITACRIDCETRYLVENCNCRMVHMPGKRLSEGQTRKKIFVQVFKVCNFYALKWFIMYLFVLFAM